MLYPRINFYMGKYGSARVKISSPVRVHSLLAQLKLGQLKFACDPIPMRQISISSPSRNGNMKAAGRTIRFQFQIIERPRFRRSKMSRDYELFKSFRGMSSLCMCVVQARKIFQVAEVCQQRPLTCVIHEYPNWRVI